MFVNKIVCLAANPFIDAYVHSDLLGKAIFLSLIFLSIASWVILLHKSWMTYQARKNSLTFSQSFHQQRLHPLDVNFHPSKHQLNPFYEIYLVLKKQTTDLLHKNFKFGQHSSSEESPFLSPSDISLVEANLVSQIALQTQKLEKNLFYLSTITSLAPFLGLLGTVWGILITFADLQAQGSGNSHQMMLGGLSLALATTVLGLIDAIPALVGYNYLKNTIRNYETEMEGFSTEILSAIEIQYRKVDVYD